MEQFIELPASAPNDRPRLGLFNPQANVELGDLTPADTPKRKAKAKGDRDLPLWQRTDGRWCRKIKGRVHYFGTDKDKALEQWAEEKDDLLAGRTPRGKSGALTVGELCDRFLQAKEMLRDSGELSPRTFGDYRQTTDRIVAQFRKNRTVADLAADDFEAMRREIGKTRGLVGLANAVRMVRIVFKYAHDAGLIENPVRFGPMFKVKREKIRKAAIGKPARMFEADQLRRILKAADPTMEAMILLGINCAFGQTDIANLPKAAVDLKAGWVNFPRVKTSVSRKVPLWPETVAAVRKAIAARPEPADATDAGLVFITRFGRRWTRSTENGGAIDGIAQEFGKLLTTPRLKREGLGFYALRHTFATVSSDACDQIATNAIMGHLAASDEMPGRYRHGVADERLQKVAEHVRRWLFPAKRKAR